MNRTTYYILHPWTWLRYQWSLLKTWRFKHAAIKRTQAKMTEIRLMEANLKAASYPGCSKCYGQGHRGFNLTTKTWQVCSCTYNPRTQDRVDAHPWLKS